METNNYLNALRTKQKDIDKMKISTSKISENLKKQNKKCARCKKDLRSSYYKRVGNQIVCSDCL